MACVWHDVRHSVDTQAKLLNNWMDNRNFLIVWLCEWNVMMHLFTLTFENLLYAEHHSRRLGVVAHRIDKIPAPIKLIFHQGTDQNEQINAQWKLRNSINLRSLSFAPVERSEKEETCKHIYGQAHSSVFVGWFSENIPLHGTHANMYKHTHAHWHTPTSWTCNALEIHMIVFWKKSARDRHM